MKVIVLSKLANKSVFMKGDFIPRIGDTVDLFYEPLPKVIGVILYPTKERLKQLKISDINVVAIVMVD